MTRLIFLIANLVFLVFQLNGQTIAVIGDFGNTYAGDQLTEVAALMDSWNPEAIITTGDNNYPVGSAETIDTNIGQFFSEYIFPYSGSYSSSATENMFWPCLGNHDYDGSEGAQPYFDYLELPGNERYYDVVVGNVHLFSLNSNSQEPDGREFDSTQALWLQEALQNSTAPWKIVYFHHSPYSSGLHGNNEIMQWPFKDWGASAVISGHDHHYEMSKIDCLPFIVNGIGGPGSSSSNPSGSAFSEIAVGSIHGALKIDASEDTLAFELWTTENVLLHEFELFAPGVSNNLYECQTVLSHLPKIPSEMFFEPLDSDELKEIIYQTSNGIECIRNCGNGIFQEATALLDFENEITFLEFTDVDQDGKKDYIIREENGRLTCFKGDGIIPPETAAIIDESSGLAFKKEYVLDIDGDFDKEIVLYNEEEKKVLVSENLGGFQFSSATEILDLGLQTVNQIQIRDMNNDGLTDIIVFNSNGEIGYFLNLGSFIFSTEFEVIYTLENSVLYAENQWLNLDEDEELELVISYENAEENVFELSFLDSYEGEYSLVNLTSVSTEDETPFNSPKFGDLEGDGDIDVFVSQFSQPGKVRVITLEEGTVSAEFILEEDYENDFFLHNLTGEDGVDVLFVESFIGGKIVQHGLEDETWSEEKILISTPAIFFSSMVFFNDLDLDGDLELIMPVIAGPGVFYVFMNQKFDPEIGIPGDFDLDGIVSSADLTEFLSYFGENCSNCPQDFSQDGLIGSFDLTVFLSFFGNCTE